MGLNVPDRVHLIPVGYEHDRVVDPAKEYRADKVVLVRHFEDDQRGKKYWDMAIEDFKESDIDYTIAECDIFDLYDSLGTISEYINLHKNDQVYVNVSSGSKITAIAGMIASMVLDATAYYAKVAEYGEHPSEIERVTELPKYPIDTPEPQQIAVLEYIQREIRHEGPPSKGDVIHFSEQAHLPYIMENVAGKGKYRLLDANIITPLKEKDYIQVSKSGRSKILDITEEGEAALEAFRWLVNEAIDWEEVLDFDPDEGHGRNEKEAAS